MRLSMLERFPMFPCLQKSVDRIPYIPLDMTRRAKLCAPRRHNALYQVTCGMLQRVLSALALTMVHYRCVLGYRSGYCSDSLRIIQPSQQLYQFLANNSEHVTHFFIGTNILQYPDLFKTAFETNQDDIAVHTWTHPYMTTRTNLEILGELGWTMELIQNSTGGRIPKYWRPPFGDSDMRVRAIANEVFGLKAVLWNQEYAAIFIMDSFLPTSF